MMRQPSPEAVAAHPLRRILDGTPHRHPMLLLDRLVTIEPGRRGRATKAVSLNETHAEGGQLEGLPVGLVVDALGQLAIVVLAAQQGETPRVHYLAALEEIAFGAAPEAGRQLVMEVDVLRTWRGTSRVAIRASVDADVRVEGVMVLSTGQAGAPGGAPS